MSTFRVFLILVLSFCGGSCGFAEQILWRTNSTDNRKVPDLENEIPIGPEMAIRRYLLGQVFVDRGLDPDLGQPGTINAITTFFEDDLGINFEDMGGVRNREGLFEIQGLARFNFFEVAVAGDLPMATDNPGVGIGVVPALFVQNTTEGWIEVRATNLKLFGMVIELEGNYYVGLTPIFDIQTAGLFSGNHLANTMPIAKETESAFRELAPFPGDWILAQDFEPPPPPKLQLPLFATMVILGSPLEPILLGDVNCDGQVTLADIAPFVDLLTGGGFSEKADINQDLVVNLADVAPFVALLSGG